MDIRVLMRFFSILGQLRQRDFWTRQQLENYRGQALQQLRQRAYANSTFYGRFHHGLMDRPLSELPILTRATLMENFDEVVTDKAIKLKDIEGYIAHMQGDDRFLGRYWLNASSGSSGQRGFFLFDSTEWATIVASFARAYSWAGHKVSLTRRIKMASVASPTPWHMTARMRATLPNWWTPGIGLSAVEPVDSLVHRLNDWQPEVIMAYASMAHVLADQQLAGKLNIHPRLIFSGSEKLGAEARRRIQNTWGPIVFNQYGVTECGCLGAECTEHQGLHLFEDLVIVEVVDNKNKPVLPGEYGEKLLITVLFNHTQPLIRYELEDSIKLAVQPCTCGRSYALVEDIQGRTQDTLYFPTAAGEQVAVRPVIFHQIMELLALSGWQIIQEPHELRVLVTGARPEMDDQALGRALEQMLAEKQIIVPPIKVERVSSIPRSAVGKTPLIKSNVPRP